MIYRDPDLECDYCVSAMANAREEQGPTTYPWWNIDPIDGCPARYALQDSAVEGRSDPEVLIDTSVEVGQLGEAAVRDLVDGTKRGEELILEFLHTVAVFQQIIEKGVERILRGSIDAEAAGDISSTRPMRGQWGLTR